MGFFEQSTAAQPYPVTALLSGFQAQCTLDVFGLLQTFLNDETKGTFTLKQVLLYGLEVGNPAASMSLSELYIRKDECHALAFDQALPHEQTGLMPRTEPVAVYTSHYAIQGGLHMGADALLADVIESSKSIFVGVTDAYIFPLFEAQTAVVQQAPLVFVYRGQVRMHHRAGG
jgi:hypothetical protein